MKRILVLVCLVLFLGSFVSAESGVLRADRFVNNGNGTVTDTKTGMMWADKDNGSGISWYDAKSYCEGYSGGGKSGWRMPTIGDLGQLYNSGAYGSVIKATGYKWFVWSSETSGDDAAFFGFIDGGQGWARQYFDGGRALPVRWGK